MIDNSEIEALLGRLCQCGLGVEESVDFDADAPLQQRGQESQAAATVVDEKDSHT
jgi:hypothetical protein